MYVEVFADLWCPFAHLGLRRFDDIRRRSRRPDMHVVVRAWPLELVNREPMAPSGIREKVDALRHQLDVHLFQHVDPEHFPTSTLDALSLERRAYRVDVATGERMSFDLRNALFEQGRDISDARVLSDLAARLGVPAADATDRSDVVDDWDEGRRRGVIGSPHFFCGDANAFCPSLDITRNSRNELSIHADATRMIAFLQQCFEG